MENIQQQLDGVEAGLLAQKRNRSTERKVKKYEGKSWSLVELVLKIINTILNLATLLANL